MINKILVANRGEIACRVFATAKQLNIATVAVYSDIDSGAKHVKMADEAICLGPAPAAQSYLNGELIIKKAVELGVDAIHPGYGFLSENANFANLCEQHDIVFIGPPASAIEAMGSKSAAKTIMQNANVPLVPGYHGDNQDQAFLFQQAEDMGYPVLLKAAAGGGGKGMRQVWSSEEFDEALAAAKREAMKSFSDDLMLIEKYLTEPRHVEIQVFCDSHGNGVYLFERDCSVQRRHQKIIEEAPAPGLSAEIREAMGEAALKAASAINYVGAGTVEFLLDSDGSFYFMEMNTRLQVEHPVTEFITGEDLVAWQIHVANGLPLPKTQAQLSMRGHAFEARIYAEDPANDFLPATGLLEFIREPNTNAQVRVDSGVVTGDEVSVYYDPMIAKLVVYSDDRAKALALLEKSLKQYMICGVTTNINYLLSVAGSEAFKNAELTTDFIERHQDALAVNKGAELSGTNLIAVYAGLLAKQDCAYESANYPGFRLNHSRAVTLKFAYNDEQHEVNLLQLDANTWQLANEENTSFTVEKQANLLTVRTASGISKYAYAENDAQLWVLCEQGLMNVQKHQQVFDDSASEASSGDICAPMNGTLISMNVAPNQEVKKGDLLAIVEAMKMEHSLRAPFDGVVNEVSGAVGQLVDGGSLLVSIEASE